MCDQFSSCCTSTSTSSISTTIPLAPFAHRFHDLPEPVRTRVIQSSMHVVKQNLENCAERILRGARDPCSACIEQLSNAVMATDVVGLRGVEEYRMMAVHLLRLERLELMKRLEAAA